MRHGSRPHSRPRRVGVRVDRERVRSDRPQRARRQLAVNAQGRGAGHVHARTASAARPRVGRDERDRADAARAPQVAFRLDYAGGWGKYKSDYWKTFQQRVQGLHRPGARLDGHRVHGAGRLLLGPAGLAADAAELRPRPAAAAGDVGAAALALDRRPAAARRSTPTGPGTSGITSSARTPTRRAGLRLPLDLAGVAARHVRPQRLRRHVRLGLRRGLEAREQLPDAHATGAFCYSSTRTAPTRPATA